MNLCILGSTGTIGVKALEVVLRHPGLFTVSALVAGENVELIYSQIIRHRPKVVALKRPEDVKRLRDMLGTRSEPELLWGLEGIKQAVAMDEVDVVVSAISGSAGLIPTYFAALNSKNIALANKETLIMAGPIIMGLVKEKGIWLRPIDSEHSAVFSAIQGHDIRDIRKVIITASGGPFRGRKRDELIGVKVAEALKHPNWKMGAKITIDSATMMNKGLEVIEAMWLFDLPLERIEVLIHPQSIIHSMVEFVDGSILAQLSVPDMTIPIAYALTYPRRVETSVPSLKLSELNNLSFEPVDKDMYPCFALAMEAAMAGGSSPIVLNAANEEAVNAFLKGVISFTAISEIIEKVLNMHYPEEVQNMEHVLDLDRRAREMATRFIMSLGA